MSSEQFKISRAIIDSNPDSTPVSVEQTSEGREPAPFEISRASLVNPDGSVWDGNARELLNAPPKEETEQDSSTADKQPEQPEAEATTAELAKAFTEIRENPAFKDYLERYTEEVKGKAQGEYEDGIYQLALDIFGANELEVEAAIKFSEEGNTNNEPAEDLNGDTGTTNNAHDTSLALQQLWGIEGEEFEGALDEVLDAFSKLPMNKQLEYDNIAGANLIYQQIQTDKRRANKAKEVPTFQRSRGMTQTKQEYKFTEQQLAEMSPQEYARRNDEILQAYSMGLVKVDNGGWY